MGESRQELLQWMNNLLQLNITKVEQCGTGAPLCQIFDSIFLDVPMSRVKFNVNTEYGYLQNFKVLQNTFSKHQIDRPIPVEALIKCKMQDNLEFLQWTKRYWDQYFPGIDYDPVSRRKAAGTSASAGPSSFGASTRSSVGQAAPAAVRRPAGGAAGGTARVAPRAAGGGGSAAASALERANASLKENIVGLERERDFYFNKLREIEVLLQEEVLARPELEAEEGGLVPRLQAILYSTEEGFEIPAEEGEGEEYDEEGVADEETF